jgi:hypothetical protein
MRQIKSTHRIWRCKKPLGGIKYNNKYLFLKYFLYENILK